jgi:hypothetical protein
MSDEDDVELISKKLAQFFQTTLSNEGYPSLTENTRQMFQEAAGMIFQEALQNQEIEQSFYDQFQIETFIDHANNSLEARMTPKTQWAQDAVMKFWIPDPCIIQVNDTRVPLPRHELELEYMQQVVGGYIELVSVLDKKDWVLVVDEEAKLKKKMVNPTATCLHGDVNDFVAGTVIFCPRDMI